MNVKIASSYIIQFISIATALLLLNLAIDDTIPYLYPDPLHAVIAGWILFVVFVVLAVVFSYIYKESMEEYKHEKQKHNHHNHDKKQNKTTDEGSNSGGGGGGKHVSVDIKQVKEEEEEEEDPFQTTIETANSAGTGFELPDNVITSSSSSNTITLLDPTKENKFTTHTRTHMKNKFNYNIENKHTPRTTYKRNTLKSDSDHDEDDD